MSEIISKEGVKREVTDEGAVRLVLDKLAQSYWKRAEVRQTYKDWKEIVRERNWKAWDASEVKRAVELAFVAGQKQKEVFRKRRCIIREGWAFAGREGTIIGESVFVEQSWTPVLWDDEEDPEFFKTGALQIIEERCLQGCENKDE